MQTALQRGKSPPDWVEIGRKGGRPRKSEEPREKKPTGRPPKYPFRTMQVGDTYLAVGITRPQLHKTLAYYKPSKFKCRSLLVGGSPCVRVWRIA